MPLTHTSSYQKDDEPSWLKSALVVTEPGHEAFYGKYRTYLKHARNLPAKGQKRKQVEETEHRQQDKLQKGSTE